MHRNLWSVAGGYDESFIYYGHMEINFFLRLLKKFQGADLSPIVECDFYHLDHVSTWSVLNNQKRLTNPLENPDNPPPTLCPNDDSWGLADYEVPLLAPPREAINKRPIDWRLSWTPRFVFETARSTIITFYRVEKIRSFVGGLFGRKLKALAPRQEL